MRGPKQQGETKRLYDDHRQMGAGIVLYKTRLSPMQPRDRPHRHAICGLSLFSSPTGFSSGYLARPSLIGKHSKFKFGQEKQARLPTAVREMNPRPISGNRAYQESVSSRPLSSSKNPHFQNEAIRTTLLVKTSFICLMKNHFRIKG